MKVNLKQLKLHPGESETFAFKVDPNDSIWENTGLDLIEPLEIQLAVKNTGNNFAGQGYMRSQLRLPCSRCLKEFAFPLNSELDLTMVEDTGRLNQSDDFIVFSGDEVDITSGVQEQIFLSIPINPLCKPTCQGLCPVCGVDKNHGKCSCEEREIDPRWEKLKNLT